MTEILILKKRKDFLRVARGVSKVTRTAILQAALNLSEGTVPPKVGYTTTKKIGKANVRNKARRRMRAVIREILPIYGINNVEYVLIGRHNTHYCPYKELRSDIKWAIKKVNQMLNPDNSKTEDFVCESSNENSVDISC